MFIRKLLRVTQTISDLSSALLLRWKQRVQSIPRLREHLDYTEA